MSNLHRFIPSAKLLVTAIVLVLAQPLSAFAKDEAPPPSPPSFLLGYLFTGLFIALGVVAVCRQTKKTVNEDE